MRGRMLRASTNQVTAGRQFEGKTIVALITKWAPATQDDEALWHIVHEGDGDEEDLDENEVREGLALLERERGGPSKEKGTSRAGRKRQSFDAAALQGKRSKR